MIRKILNVKDPILRKKSKPVKKIDKKILDLIQDLKDTLKAQTDPEGVGLAAPQIGKNIKVLAMKPKDKIRVVINPKILSVLKTTQKKPKDKEKKILEGCLSLPHFYSPLNRPQTLKVEYLAENGKLTTEVFEGVEAQIIQHEIDHLNGVVFIDRLLEQKRPLYELVGDTWEKVELS